YEGKTTPEIRRERPGWSLFRHGLPNGETIAQVAVRARNVIDRALTASGGTPGGGTAGGDVALFAHGHILRILTACWLDLPPESARLFALSTASISTLGYEHETRVIARWNMLPDFFARP